ncbi:hypothetical protein D1641_13485 [Colidextribacter sp. OB.20]|uniref:hypothetical protein n=1 Tax=Colidextribacter sp. OB.20 TaxID=2304568 RepID=UPI00137199E7|nr:hypothetical protein [Colidextribacter sp. OB.20]NBI11014.1 hypothetical protein [Colidextribacter sp. OB.20]
MNAEEKKRHFQELTLNLQHEGFVVKPETEDGLLPVGLDGQRLCLALDSGGVRYWKEDAADEHRSAALDRVISIAKTTAEYMSQMEAAPRLTVSGLTGDYRLLADFNGIVLASHPTQYGVQFITWERTQDGTGLNQGNYYGPLGGTGCYTAAKRGFATRSGLVPRSALFTLEQLTEVYRCIHETLESEYPISDERQRCLESTAEQIEQCVPELDERVTLSNQKEVKLTSMESPQEGRMQFS